MINLTHTELFADLTSINHNGEIIDLHNEYDCLGYRFENKTLSVNFKNIASEDYACLLFKNSTIIKHELLTDDLNEIKTLCTFYRGRFEEKGMVLEYSEDYGNYFYIEFENGTLIELFSTDVNLLLI